MLFGIDFDGVFDRDPAFFKALVVALRAAGHDAVLVTARSDEGGWGEEVRSLVGDAMPIVFAAGRWKEQAARDAGYHVNVWVDDNPQFIQPATQTPQEHFRTARAAGLARTGG